MVNAMNRMQWLFTGLFALLLALTAGLVLIVRAGQTMDSTERNEVGEFVSMSSPVPPALTAAGGYERALPVAQSWAKDAQLWRAQGTWPVGSDLTSAAVAWNYTFYSESEQAIVQVRVTAGNFMLHNAHPVASNVSPLDVDLWQLDSPAVYELLHANGGEAFLTIHPRRSLILTLVADGQPRWHARLINEGPIGNAAGQQMLDIFFNAQDGTLITTPIHGADNE